MDIPVLRRRNHHRGEEHSTGDVEQPGTAALSSTDGGAGWSPWAEFGALYERMGRLMDQIWSEDSGWRPAADVEETSEAYLVEVELPGVKREDVSVEFGAGELAVSGELTRRERVGFLRSRTRPVGRFHYRVRLPAEVEDSTITASLTDGVLTVRVPKAPAARARKIEIAS